MVRIGKEAAVNDVLASNYAVTLQNISNCPNQRVPTGNRNDYVPNTAPVTSLGVSGGGGKARNEIKITQ
jgi:hypothetical protein